MKCIEVVALEYGSKYSMGCSTGNWSVIEIFADTALRQLMNND